ncbi:isopenicillin N synthase family oxygenase [Nostoc sp. UCD121]|uniref:isopenicillin N synthase family dioxygenase n=1 Tax=unclassified Nostoc TaxID=2593658 RepID=UPI001624DF30|nr:MULTISPECIES: isopenicillin N synthase family oxygenase [unclassified Nostoc]MBC1218765.1 isopenicillin N synthase family oxygenase [Nostoc sp. UCD120]MBC1279681.1 isopenicillin N synthase family oxygenase [Nostoc sp. UCD121]MBC1299566.1 isopenicillin N synthase family oxygenase [Nostoc sp. UCD122]
MVTIPIIDLSAFTHSNATNQQAVVKQIYQACHEIGFIYLRNSGISKDLIEQVFSYNQSFFKQTLEVKQKQAWSDEFWNTGDVAIERERLAPNKPGDLKEAFNVNKEGTVGMDACIVAFYDSCTKLANTVLQIFALALELPKDFLTTKHNQYNHTLRLLHYPPLQTPPKPGQVRAGEHSDYGSITLLFQDKVSGLEVKTTAGEWIEAAAIPDTVIVNTGDLMQRWTNHVFCSTHHRVMIPNDDRVNQSRYSIAFFCHPNDDVEIACLQSCHKGKSPIYPPILAREYLLQRLQATY